MTIGGALALTGGIFVMLALIMSMITSEARRPQLWTFLSGWVALALGVTLLIIGIFASVDFG